MKNQIKQIIKKKRYSKKLFLKKKILRTQTVPDILAFGNNKNHHGQFQRILIASPAEMKRSKSDNRVPDISSPCSNSDMPTSECSVPPNSEIVASRILETMNESFLDDYYSSPQFPDIQPQVDEDTQSLATLEKEYAEMASCLNQLKTRAKVLGVEIPKYEPENTLNDKTNLIHSTDLANRLSKMSSLSSLNGQWIFARRLLTAKGGIKLKAPPTIKDLLLQAGKALKIEACKVRDFQTQLEILTLDSRRYPIVFITSKEEEKLYFSELTQL